MKKPCVWVAWVIVCILALGVAACGEGSGAATTTAAPGVGASGIGLEQRVQEWAALLESVEETQQDMTAQIAAYLWPREEAAERAAEYQEAKRAKVDARNPIVDYRDVGPVRVTLDDSGQAAAVLYAMELVDRDGRATQSVQVITWTKQDGTWYRTVSFQPLPAKVGGPQPLDVGLVSGDFTWSVFNVGETKQIALMSDAPETAGMFLIVWLQVANSGQVAQSPGGYSLWLVDESGREFATSSAADSFFYVEAAARMQVLDPGLSCNAVYFFEVPEGLDLSKLRFDVRD